MVAMKTIIIIIIIINSWEGGLPWNTIASSTVASWRGQVLSTWFLMVEVNIIGLPEGVNQSLASLPWGCSYLHNNIMIKLLE